MSTQTQQMPTFDEHHATDQVFSDQIISSYKNVTPLRRLSRRCLPWHNCPKSPWRSAAEARVRHSFRCRIGRIQRSIDVSCRRMSGVTDHTGHGDGQPASAVFHPERGVECHRRLDQRQAHGNWAVTIGGAGSHVTEGQAECRAALSEERTCHESGTT